MHRSMYRIYWRREERQKGHLYLFMTTMIMALKRLQGVHIHTTSTPFVAVCFSRSFAWTRERARFCRCVAVVHRSIRVYIVIDAHSMPAGRAYSNWLWTRNALNARPTNRSNLSSLELVSCFVPAMLVFLYCWCWCRRHTAAAVAAVAAAAAVDTHVECVERLMKCVESKCTHSEFWFTYKFHTQTRVQRHTHTHMMMWDERMMNTR